MSRGKKKDCQNAIAGLAMPDDYQVRDDTDTLLRYSDLCHEPKRLGRATRRLAGAMRHSARRGRR